MRYGYSAIDSTATMVWLIIAAVLAIVGGIVLYFTFLNKKNDGKFKGFLGWLHDFLTFKKMFIENLLKVTYLILSIFITLSSFAAGSFLGFIFTLILGNLAVRVIYEFSLVLLVICRNTTEINKKLSKEETKNTVSTINTEE